METNQTGVQVVENLAPTVEKIQLTLNLEILKELKKEKISINQLFVLFSAYYEANDLLDIYDNKTSDDEVIIFDYEDLIIHGFLEDCEEAVLFKISNKGKEFVEKIHDLTGNEEPSQEQNIKKLCQDYLELWPKVKLPSQKYARVSILEIEKKMKTWLKVNKPMFKKEYEIKITDQDILDVTKNYIDRYAKNGYKFMVTSSYFIQKNEKSVLSDELIAIKQGYQDVINQPAKTNITVQ